MYHLRHDLDRERKRRTKLHIGYYIKRKVHDGDCDDDDDESDVRKARQTTGSCQPINSQKSSCNKKNINHTQYKREDN